MAAHDPGTDDPLVDQRAIFAAWLASGADAEGWPAERFIAPSILIELVGRLRDQRGCDWQPACSLWVQIYLNTLLIPATAALARDRLPLEPQWHGLRARFCAASGVPLAFAISGEEDRPDPASATGGASLSRLLAHHVAPLLAGVSAVGGLSRRMLWEGVGHSLAWTLGQISATGLVGRDDARRLSLELEGPPAAAVALEAVRRTVCEGVPFKRRLCCLRHRIDGFGPCTGICPLTHDADGRRRHS